MLFEDKDRQVNTQSLSDSTRRFKPGIGSAFKAGAPGEREGGGVLYAHHTDASNLNQLT